MKQVHEKNIRVNILGKAAGRFINQFSLTILMILLILAVGLVGLFSLPKESLPEIVFPSLSVQTIFPGANPEDVEALVTIRVENKLKDLDDINSIQSETRFGISTIGVTFNEDVDIDLKKIEVDNVLKEMTFTEGVLPPRSFIFTTSEIPLMNLSVSGEYDQEQLTRIADAVAAAVESQPGIEEVIIYGGVKREIEVELNELAMMQYGVVFNDLRNALAAQNYTTPIGELDLNGVRYNLRVDESFRTLEDIRQTKITPDLTIQDVAEVYDGLAEIKTYSRTFVRTLGYESVPSVFLTVSRKVGSDVIRTTEDIQTLLIEGQGVLYPDDVNVAISNALADNVERDLDKIQSSAVSGLIVVIIVLFLFIGIRESLIVSITIPLSLFGTLGILSVFGITFNTFAILGMIVALGLLVDNSIIVMENIDRLRKKGMTPSEAALYGTNQVGYPITSSTMTTLAAFFPLAILPGILGDFVSTIPITIMITISVSLFVSIVITPSLASRILTADKPLNINKSVKNIGSVVIVAVLSGYAFYDPDNMVLMAVMMILFSTLMILKLRYAKEGLENTKLTLNYSLLIGWIVQRKRRSVAIILLGVLVLAFSMSSFFTGVLKIAFFPSSNPTSFSIKIDTVGGSTLEQTDAIVSEVEALLYGYNEITQFNTTIGGNEVDYAVITADLKRNIDGFEVLNRMEQAINRIPGAKFTIDTVVAGPPVGKPIELKVLGEDLDVIESYGDDIANTLNKLDGVFNVESSSTQGVPQLLIDLDKNLGLEYGVTAVQIGNQLRGELTGVKATTVRIGQEEIDVYIRKDKTLINNVDEVGNLFIATPASNMITLKSLSNLIEESGVSNITREDGKRLITISADLKAGYNVNDVVAVLEETFNPDATPEGIQLSYGGDVAGIETNFGNLFQSMILAVFLVFMILTVQFGSIKQPFIVLTTIPMAIIGVIWGLIITGNEFGFYAFMGLVALVGIAVNDAIVLIDYINYLKKEGYETQEAIKEAGQTRFNPVLATTLTTISGVLPLAFKEAYYAQFSFSLIFGLLVTTVLTLVFIPTIYNLFSRKGEVR
jgi:HAE1 family hydrophobic/amphiphilic exporter-1